MARGGFKAQPSSIHSHANQTSQRADQVSQAGSAAGGAAVHGGALGVVGSGTAGKHQQLTGRLQGAVNKAGTRLQGHADQLHRTGDSISGTDDEHASRFRGIHEPTSNVRNPHAQSGSRATGGNIPPEAHTMAQWIKDHRQNGSIIDTRIPHNGSAGQVDVGQKIHPVVSNGTQYNPNQRPNPNGNTYGGRIYGNQTNNPDDKLPEIGHGNWDQNGYFKTHPAASNPNGRPGQYYEFDTHPTPNWTGTDKPNRQPGQGAQGGRVVVGDDGSMYYSDHYQNPQMIQGPVIKPR